MTEFQFQNYTIRTSSMMDELILLLKITQHGFAICTCDDTKTLNFFNNKLKEYGKKNNITIRDKVYDRKEEDLIEYLETEKNTFMEKIRQKLSTSERLSFSIRGLETQLEAGDVGRLNILRDYFLSFDYFVLLWIPSSYLRDIAEKAPDFWRIRRKVFQFDASEKHNELGLNQLSLSPYSSQQNFDKSISQNPQNLVAHNNKGIALLQQNKLKESLICFQKAVELNPKSVQFLNNYGIAFCLSKQHNRSLQYFETALKIDNTDSTVLINYGLALTRLSSFRKAISCFNKVKQHSPDHKFASLYLSQVYLQTSHLNNAKTLLESILNKYPNFISAMVTSGITETKLGNYDDASDLFSRALNLDSENSEALLGQAILLSKKKKYHNAIDEINKISISASNRSKVSSEKRKILKKLS